LAETDGVAAIGTLLPCWAMLVGKKLQEKTTAKRRLKRIFMVGSICWDGASNCHIQATIGTRPK
jgi:hypothetical protein